MHKTTFARIAGPLLVALVLGACGSEEQSPPRVDEAPVVVTPEIVAFGADRSTIDAGASVTLDWKTRNVLDLALADGSGTPISLEGRSVENGSIVLQPDATTSYTLTATGEDASVPPAWRTITVTVREKPLAPPEVVEFKAKPAEVPVDTSATLSWKTTNATRVTIKDDAGHTIELGTAGVAEGQVAVKPTRSPTVYVLTADGPGGRNTAQASVTLAGRPRIVRFDVSPLAPIDIGGSVTLGWATTNADQVRIEQDGKVIVDSSTELTSTKLIELSDSAEFVLTATSAAGTAEARVVARVGPRIVAFSSSSHLVREGDEVTLQWELADADRAIIDGPGGTRRSLEGAELTSGAAPWEVAGGGNIVLRAFRKDVERTAVVRIDVTDAPRIHSLTVDKTRVTALHDDPETVKLSWVQGGAETCTIYRANVPVPGFDGFPCGDVEFAEVLVPDSSRLRLEARNDAGVHTAAVDIEAIVPASILAFGATQSGRLNSGDEVELSWVVEDADSVRITRDVAPFDGFGPLSSSGSVTDPVFENTTYTLTAKNVLGYPVMAKLLVRAGAPEILSAEAEPSLVAVGKPFVVRWSAHGGNGDTLTVSRGSGPALYTTDEPTEIDDGQVAIEAPESVGDHVYVVRVQAAGGEFDESPVTVTTTDGPIIRSFTANRTTIDQNGFVTLGWEVSNDSADAPPTLSLTDELGTPYTVSSSNQGSLQIQLSAERKYTFTLTARTTAERQPHTRTVEVLVVAPALLSQFAATPEVVGTSQGIPEVVLSWTSERCIELQIFEANAAGEPTSEALLRLTAEDGNQAAIDSGSLEVYPATSTTYLARVRNAAGTVVQKTARVTVDPPRIDTLSANPEVVIAGEASRLSWTTSFATGVRIKPIAAVVNRIGNTYVDVSASGTAQSFPGAAAVRRIDFPAGFVFPFGGENRTSIMVSTRGWAGFNLLATEPSYVQDLPNNSRRDINFAVFSGEIAHTQAYPNSTVYYARRTDSQGDCFIVQWKRWFIGTSSVQSDLNFQLVLRPNGDFEYRYGTMTGLSSWPSSYQSPLIGFQYPTAGSPGMKAVPNPLAVAGGLENSGFSFSTVVPPSGSMDVVPEGETTYTVTPLRPDFEGETQEIIIKAWEVPVIASFGVDPKHPQVGAPFSIGWTVKNGTQLRLLDGETELYVTEDPSKIASYKWETTVSSAGPRRYTLEVINGISRNVSVRHIDVTVYGGLSIDVLTVTPSNLENPGEVAVHWETTGAVDLLLLACEPRSGACVDVTPTAADPSVGTLVFFAERSVVFRLTIVDSVGRGIEREEGAWFGAGTLDWVNVSNTQISAGESVTFEWNSTNQDYAWLEPRMFEATIAAPFIDISSNGVATTLSGSAYNGYYNVVFPDGFTFPWFGTQYTQLRATTNGYITFDMTHTSALSAEQPMPTNASNAAVHIAPFWDYLAQGTGPVRWKLVDPPVGERYLVVMWHGAGFASQSGAQLNFEVVFFEDGALDFRYGAMTFEHASSSNWRHGQSATMGWQSPDRSISRMLTERYQTPMSGGLAGRSWRFFPAHMRLPADGSITVTPTETTVYTLCTTNDSGYNACEDILVEVL